MARFARTEAPLTRRALITGITGQDGSYLAEYLLTQGYEVWGLVRGQSNPRVRGVRQLLGDIGLVRGDLLDQGSLIAAVERSRRTRSTTWPPSPTCPCPGSRPS